MRHPRPALLVMLVSIAVIAATSIVLLLGQVQDQQAATITTIGSRDAASLQAEIESPSPAPSTASTPVPTPSSSPSQAEPVGIPIPMRVAIPAIDVDTKVIPGGLDKNGALAIPEDITKVGWYDLGVAPGSDRGSAVLVAHRDGRVQGRGVFYDLGTLSKGDRVVVTNSAGEKLAFTVVSRESINKKRLPLEELFAIDGPPRLTLISCGGYYDRDRGGYQDNVVVTAVQMQTA